MRPNAGTWLIVFTAVVVAALLGGKYRAGLAQQEEIDRLRAAAAGRALLAAEQVRLQAAQADAAQLAAWRSEREALPALRTAVETAQRKLDLVTRAAAEKQAAFERFPAGVTVPATEWRNAGGATPAAALETVLWAAAGGDVGVLAQRLKFFAGAQKAATALMESLPPALRDQVKTPEETVAFFTIKDVPLGSVQVRQWSESSGPFQQIALKLAQPDGQEKDVNLIFLRGDDGWQLMVTDAVVARYAALVPAAPKE
jgi:hypothetical protein